MLEYIIIGAIIVVTALSFGYKVYQAKKQSPNSDAVELVLAKLRPELLRFLTVVTEVKDNMKTYEELEKYMIFFLLVRIDELNILTAEERKVIDEELIANVIRPYLTAVWEKEKGGK